MSRLHVAIVYSQPSHRILATPFSETDDDTKVIAQTVAKGLKALGHTVAVHPVSEDNISAIKDIKADCVFNLIEWCGHDISLAEQAFEALRALNLPVTGNSWQLYNLTANKITMKEALASAGISLPSGATFITRKEPISPNLKYPVLVKPATEHCSAGLGYDTIAHQASELRSIIVKQIQAFEQPVIAEEFITGREFEVYLLEDKEKVIVLPIEEVIFSGSNPLSFQTYAAKWVEEDPDYQNTEIVVAKLNDRDYRAIESECLKAFRALGFWGYARFDVRLREGRPYLLETNANPSVYDDTEALTDVRKEVIPGIKFVDYLSKIIDSALSHFDRGERV